MVSADFSDAYTQSKLIDLQRAIEKLGLIVHWPVENISLCIKLAELTFNNCYFETPEGIHRQSQGFPMGGHSSREGLDTILLASEIDLLKTPGLDTYLKSYMRLVDDVSLIANTKFSNLRQLITLLGTHYPRSMPLNIQISFGYSQFLDVHITNVYPKEEIGKFSTSLAYKPLAQFDFTTYDSNVSPTYKGKTWSDIRV